MKKLAAICLLLLSLNARADLVVVESMDMGGQSQDLTMKIKGDKARVDMGTGMASIIIDANTGDMITLMHGQKMYMKISGEKAKEMMEQMKKARGNDAASNEAPKITDTGRKEKVGDYNAEVYTGEMQGGIKFTFWVTKDIPDYASIQAQMQKLQTLQEKFGQKAPDMSKIEGVPVKTVTTMPDGKIFTMTLTSVKTQPVDDADLAPPAGYTEMQMPQMPPGAGAPPQQ